MSHKFPTLFRPKDFQTFLNQMTITNQTLGTLTDFAKVKDQIALVEMHLNELNYLLGKDDLQEAIDFVFKCRPEAFSVLGLLVAVDSERTVKSSETQYVTVASYFKTPTEIMTFLKETGLDDLFRTRRITNLVDYAFGVEVGLDTNARKNRGGKVMETMIGDVFRKNGIRFESQVNSTDLPGLAPLLGVDKKRFDFVIRAPATTYLIETNYYSGGGSKPNEVARSYQNIAAALKDSDRYTFVWITDGAGWKKAASKLQEAYAVIPYLYNLTTLDDFVNYLRMVCAA